tara:strand:- start:900 stop:1664 length:765 start_codon:yes stop_codon:yes gene_type:complete
MIKGETNFRIYPLPLLEDNIAWIWVEGKNAVVIDPSITEPIKSWLIKKNLSLKAVLQTHHHIDHIGGTEGLLKCWPKAEVVAAESDHHRIPFQTLSVKDEEEFFLMDYPIKVLEVKGHTRTHISFFLQDNLKQKKKPPALFCGDTLFSGGCGRLFEGSPKEMYLSLKRLNSLPIETQIFCGHEYTENNLRWAHFICPENEKIKLRLQEVIKRRKLGLCSLPSSIAIERKTNLFILSKNINEFTYLRKHKDNWRG